jgi:NADH-quinone oxidoreductase subunit K
MFFFQLFSNFIIFIIGILGIILNRLNILIILMCLELIFLSCNLNFIIFSIYLDDFYGQIFSLFILTVIAAESSVGLAILIVYYRLHKNIYINKKILLKN